MKNFIKQLMDLLKIAQLKPNEVHTFQIRAGLGSYEVLIGPQKQIEVNGEIPHLIITPEGIVPTPSKAQIQKHLKGCVIIKNLVLHLKDPTGQGSELEKNGAQLLLAREKINLAGEEGARKLQELEGGGKLLTTAYQLIQQDILKALSRQS